MIWLRVKLTLVISMDEVTRTKQSLYCPISVSDMATNSAKVRQNSLREYSHAKNPAYRAFCRAPGRPQTAAFGCVYFEKRLKCKSWSPSKSNLRECVVASKATAQERSDTTANNCAVTSVCQTSRPVCAERRLLSRTKIARTTLLRTPEKICEKQAVKVNGIGHPLEDIFDKDKAETSDILIDLDFSSEEKRSDIERNEELNKIVPSENSVSDITERQLTVYHFVESGCSRTLGLPVSYHDDPLLGCTICSRDQQSVVSSYYVKIQGEGHQSTPGLGNCYSQENRALWDLLEKQLSLVSN